MAIFTKLSNKDIKSFFDKYNIPLILEYEPIYQGIQNTNYLIKTKEKKYILTIFEDKNISINLQFFLNLLHHLSEENFCNPSPLKNYEGKDFDIINNKQAAIFSFIEGEYLKFSRPEHLLLLGEVTAKLHLKTKNFKHKRKNDYSYKYLQINTQKLSNYIEEKQQGLTNLIIKDLNIFKNLRYADIPKGIIHADLFPDNVLFKNNRISGVLDYYYSCEDHLIIDLAIIIISWCFFEDRNKKIKIDKIKIKHLLKGYNKIKRINNLELELLPVYCKMYSIRFFLTRMLDAQLSHDPNIVTTKKPEEFIEKYLYLQNYNIKLNDLI